MSTTYALGEYRPSVAVTVYYAGSVYGLAAQLTVPEGGIVKPLHLPALEELQQAIGAAIKHIRTGKDQPWPPEDE